MPVPHLPYEPAGHRLCTLLPREGFAAEVISERMAITDPGNPGDVGRKRNIPMTQFIQPGRFGHSSKPDDVWLAKQEKEPILEPELPIIDTHHHLWDRGGWTYLLPELLADLNTGHNIVATVFEECRSMYRAAGPIEMRPVWRDRVRRRRRRDERERRLRPDQGGARHRRLRRSRAGRPGRAGTCADPCRR